MSGDTDSSPDEEAAHETMKSASYSIRSHKKNFISQTISL